MAKFDSNPAAANALSANRISFYGQGGETTGTSDTSGVGMIRRQLFPVDVIHRQTSPFPAQTAAPREPAIRRTVEMNPVERAAAAGAQTNSQNPIPGTNANRLPERSAAISELPAGMDVNRLANRVYDLLVRRLSSERQRRGA
jgi:hypothetical protein